MYMCMYVYIHIYVYTYIYEWGSEMILTRAAISAKKEQAVISR